MPDSNNTRLRRAGHENLVTPSAATAMPESIVNAIMDPMGVPIAPPDRHPHHGFHHGDGSLGRG
jgi:hypothetical protein